MKNVVQRFLAYLARKIVAKHKPRIIGITGSVGKTSAKEAIFLVVSQKYKARKSPKNFNNELGLPLAIIGVDSPGRNPLRWVSIILKSVFLILIRQRYPEVLVLELGVDRPGDMEYLLSIVKPNVGVITNIGISHNEFFESSADIELEKGKLAQALTQQDVLILNADNEAALRQKEKSSAKLLTYGVNSNNAEVKLTDIAENFLGKVQTSFTVITSSRKFSAKINAVGLPHLSATASAVAVAEAWHIETDLISLGLSQYRPAPGRLNIIAGIKHTLIIDDSYNAAPDSAKEALELLARIPAKQKIAVLGDMRELGSLSESAHKAVGEAAAKLHLDYLITVGEGGKIIAHGAKAVGMNEALVLSFNTADETKKSVQELLKPESAVLIKGSQAVRLEKITKEIMAEPMRARDLLCRQDEKWLS